MAAAPSFSVAKPTVSATASSGLQASGTDSDTSSGTKRKSKGTAKKTSGKRGKSRRRPRGQKAPSSDRIREIQAALAREGAYQGEPTGKWDAATAEAMKRFQAAKGLNPTGKLDALSLQKLGLGSQVAGRAAPRPSAQSFTSNGTKPR